MQVVLLKL